jgi:hypothetical protein
MHEQLTQRDIELSKYDIEPFLISCSAIGFIMTETKTRAQKIEDKKAEIQDIQIKYDTAKEGTKTKDNYLLKIEKLNKDLANIEAEDNDFDLSKSARTYCENWLKSKLYEKRKSFTSKYTNKGIRVEEDAIAYLEIALQLGFVVKNDVRKRNGFLQGECDFLHSDTVYDVKSSYDCFTFPLFESEIPESNYEWQVQGYMELYNKQKAEVVYTLMDMPQDIVDKEAFFKLGREYTKEQYEDFCLQYKYSHFPDELRIKRFKFEKDPAKIQAVHEKVKNCRKYINSLIEKVNYPYPKGIGDFRSFFKKQS